MGICNSCESTSVVTAKLILQDGKLQEFANPIKVSHVLNRNPNCFICSSDDMEIDSTLCAIDDDEELQLGELYFALPLSWLNSTLRTEEIGALAIKASQALKIGDIPKKFCGCRCGVNRKVDPLLLPNKRVAKSSFTVSGSTTSGGSHGGRGGSFGARRIRRRADGGRSRSRTFTEKLAVILEDQQVD